jgi:hypothetical protein
MSATPSPHPAPLTVLIDDVRGFKDERPALVARSSQEALALLDQLGDTRINHLWLDHDLVGDDTIRPVVDWMVQQASIGSPLNVGQIHIHSANVGGGHWMRLKLEAAHYPVTRNFALGMWTLQSLPGRAGVDGANR